MTTTPKSLREYAARLREKARREAEKGDAREWAWERSAARHLEEAAQEIEELRASLGELQDIESARAEVSG